jgi:hypothetical protein
MVERRAATSELTDLELGKATVRCLFGVGVCKSVRMRGWDGKWNTKS